MFKISKGLPFGVPILPGTKEFTPWPPHVGRHVMKDANQPPFLYSYYRSLSTHAYITMFTTMHVLAM